MRILFTIILLTALFHCDKKISFSCDQKFETCWRDCAEICEKTITHKYEFGKCFTICLDPCRKDYCKETRMVEVVDTEDLKSFANNRRGGSSPSVSIILKGGKI